MAENFRDNEELLNRLLGEMQVAREIYSRDKSNRANFETAMATLKRYNDFVVDGKLPDDESVFRVLRLAESSALASK